MITGKYTAMTVAQFLIDRSNERQQPISNLQLQKILFFAWRDYFIVNKNYLFADEIQAWQYGHVVPSVDYEYSRYSAMKLIFRYQTSIEACDDELLTQALAQYAKLPISRLVTESHKEGGSWAKIYEPCSKKIIPFHVIIDHDCKLL